MWNVIKDKKWQLYAFLVSLIIILILMYIFRNVEWIGDAWYYWNHAEMLSNGDFFLGSINGFRGYVFPLLLAILYRIGGKVAFYIFNSIFMASFFTIILPSFFEIKILNRRHCFNTILCSFLLANLFVGVIVFPLSYYIAIVCLIIALVLIMRSIKNRGFFCLLFAGVFLYFSYNIRTIYLFAIVCTIALYLFLYIKKYGTTFKIISLIISICVILLGIVIAAIPQIIMNYVNLGIFSIGVPTDNLMLSQLFWGLEYQRYDTYFSYSEDILHSIPQVYFSDPVGERIISEMGIDYLYSWSDYFKVLKTYPIDLILMYFRHFINYLFPCWPQIYMLDLNSSKVLYAIIGTIIMFLSGYVFTERCIKDYKKVILSIPLVIPALLIIPGAVEYRFSLPLYIFAIGQLCFNVDYNKLKNTFYKHRIKIVFLYLLFSMFCFAIWSNMLSTESITPLLF